MCMSAQVKMNIILHESESYWDIPGPSSYDVLIIKWKGSSEPPNRQYK